MRLRDGTVAIRPLAGTRRRGATFEEDQLLAAELLADPKERAEHLMLLDLARNDVGRVASIGSVRVTEQMVIERYSHVMHICSHVEGRLDPRAEAMDALCAGFPAGTLSGAPKVRAMEIIDELEPERRNLYGGAIGYFAGDGSMDTCIALRTAIVKDGRMQVQGVRLRRRRRQRSRRRIPGNPRQGPRPHPRRRGSGQVRAGVAGAIRPPRAAPAASAPLRRTPPPDTGTPAPLPTVSCGPAPNPK